MQAASIKPEAGACSLGQDASPEIEAIAHPFHFGRRMAERIEVLITLVSEKRTKACRQTGPARPTAPF
jgi:hypothetical protein